MSNQDTTSRQDKYTKPKYELAELFNRYWERFISGKKCSPHIRKVVRAIRNCRTAKLGIHKEKCTECDYSRYSYNSCRDRNCNKCQWSKQMAWVGKRLSELLPIPYFHVVFTLPHILNILTWFNKEVIYDLLFKAAGYILNAFAKDPKYLGAQLGFIGILHTWSQKLAYHVHIHFIVTGGGLSFDNRRFIRLPYQHEFMFPVIAMSRTMRKKFVELLEDAYNNRELIFAGELGAIQRPFEFTSFCYQVARQSWYIYAKKPFSGPQEVVEYIGRYTHRVAISNHRLVDINDGKVSFTYKHYLDKKKENYEIRETTLSSDEFIQRLLRHIVPSGFRKVRHYGFLATFCRTEKLKRAQKLLNYMIEQTLNKISKHKQQWFDDLQSFISRRCPKCGIGKLVYELIPACNSP